MHTLCMFSIFPMEFTLNICHRFSEMKCKGRDTIFKTKLSVLETDENSNCLAYFKLFKFPFPYMLTFLRTSICLVTINFCN